jgi:predicted house-cleaning noncanonical NTP pyrophosphatase (MazG superfamily)
MEYNKLVRDKIPEIISNNGQTPFIHLATEEEYWEKLKNKLGEEVIEFLEKPCEEELADMMEVLSAIMELKGTSKFKLNKIMKNKRKAKGAFKSKIILDEIKG